MAQHLSPADRLQLLERLHAYRSQAYAEGYAAGQVAGEANVKARIEPRLRRLEKELQQERLRRTPAEDLDRIEAEVQDFLEHEA
jgi:hypothetical protein